MIHAIPVMQWAGACMVRSMRLEVTRNPWGNLLAAPFGRCAEPSCLVRRLFSWHDLTPEGNSVLPRNSNDTDDEHYGRGALRGKNQGKDGKSTKEGKSTNTKASLRETKDEIRGNQRERRRGNSAGDRGKGPIREETRKKEEKKKRKIRGLNKG